MKIAITTEENLGLDSEVCGHFGHCSKFIIVETENGSVKNVKTVDNASSDCGGSCMGSNEVLKYGVDAVISGGMGAGAQQKLAAANIKVYGFSGKAKNAVASLLAGTLEGVKSCAGHSHGEGHNCGHHH